MSNLKQLAIAISLGACIASNALQAEPAPAVPANQQANQQTGKPPKIVDDMKLSEDQKQKMVVWRQQQQQHMQAIIESNDAMENMVISGNYNEKAATAAADKIAVDARKHHADYAKAFNDFYSSLSPEQKSKFTEMRKLRKAQMEAMRRTQKSSKPQPSDTPAKAQ